MKDADRIPSTNSLVDVVLVGGPDDLPPSVRTRQADATERTIKVMHRGGYEHFELDHRSSAPQPVYRWAMRTRIAE